MEPEQKKVLSDEIDLQELAIKAIVNFKKHFYFIAISSIVGILISLIAYFFLPKVYESRMIVLSDMLTESYSKEITESLKNLIKEDNFITLASRLELSAADAEKIKFIEIESVKKEKESEKGKDKTFFIITADFSKKEIISRLQNGIIHFLRNNEFVKIRVRQRKEMYQSMIEKIGVEIKSLDSLKKRLFQGLPVYSKSSEMILADPTNISSKIIELTEDQIIYKNDLELADSIQLIEGFTIFEKPAEPKLSVLMAIGLFGGFFVSLVLLVITRLFKLANLQSL